MLLYHNQLITKCCFCVSMILLITSCTKLVEVKAPETSINAQNVYATEGTAIGVMTGLYGTLSSLGNFNSYHLTSVSIWAGLSADELTLFNGIANTNSLSYFYRNELSANSITGAGFHHWNTTYPHILVCNSVIEGVSQSNSLSQTIKQQLLGEAKFMRAFCYFYLVNLYGDVPLVTSTDYIANSQLSRTPKDLVYQQIISDLKDAQTLLKDNYLDGTLLSTTNERVRPNKSTATALLARVYLYTDNWAAAEAQATAVINNTAMYSLSTVSTVFLRAGWANKEAIWQLQPVISGWNTDDARTFVINEPLGNDKPVYLSASLLSTFETGDTRKNNWTKDTTISGVTYSYPYKYKNATYNDPVTEYTMVFRLAEQYLIRAEARARQGNLQSSIDDINFIRLKHGGLTLPLPVSSTQAEMLSVILHERQIELFTEWGHRWFDLKRTAKIDGIMDVVAPGKGGTWSSYKALYPIPQADIDKNRNLIQNPGYN